MIDLLLALLLMGAGDIHRCESASGEIRFTDQPCEEHEHGASFQPDEDSAGAGPSEAQLRNWLDQLDPATPQPSRPRNQVSGPSQVITRAEPMPEISLRDRPDSQRMLAQCSSLFFQCTNGNDGQMDRCVSQIPACSGRGSAGCCHEAYVDRYRQLRDHGLSRQAAVRIALLGDRRQR